MERCGARSGEEIQAGHGRAVRSRSPGSRRCGQLRTGAMMSRTCYDRRRKEPAVKATLQKAFGYQGDSMHLPVQDLDAALPFYEHVLGFRLLSRGDAPYKSALLARDDVQI